MRQEYPRSNSAPTLAMSSCGSVCVSCVCVCVCVRTHTQSLSLSLSLSLSQLMISDDLAEMLAAKESELENALAQVAQLKAEVRM